MSDVVAPVIEPGALRSRVAELGAEIRADYQDREPVLLGVLGGAIPFIADLTRHLSPRLDIDFLGLSRFGVDGRVSIRMDSGTSLAGRDVLLIEDIVDTGLTLTYLMGLLGTRDPASLAVAALIDRTRRRIVDVPLRYRGFEAGDEFLLGYGLDWEGRYRNVPGIWAVLDLAAFQADPDVLARRVFGEPGDTVVA